jgi:hypothetical protein
VIRRESGLPLAELEAFARAGLAVLLTFAHTRIASQETIRFEGRAHSGVHLKECAGNTMTDSTRLAGLAATGHINADIKLAGSRCGNERLLDRHSL